MYWVSISWYLAVLRQFKAEPIILEGTGRRQYRACMPLDIEKVENCRVTPMPYSLTDKERYRVIICNCHFLYLFDGH